MGLTAWVAVFLVSSLFWAWILFWGGAGRLEGTFASGFLVDVFAPRWSEEGIKLFAALTWFLSAVWFVVGLFVQEARF